MEFRKLEDAIGQKKADVLMDFIVKYQQSLNSNLVTREYLHQEFQRYDEKLEAVNVRIGNLAWKMAGLLIAQTAVIIALLKFVGS